MLKRWIVLVVAVGGAPHALAQGRSPDFEAYLTLSNDYRSRGLSQLDSGVSWQVGVDYEHASGLFVGGLAANVEYAVERAFPSQRAHVVNIYTGYAWRARGWRFNAALSRYLYPDFSFDYDYSHLAFGATLMNRLSYTAGYSDRWYSRPYSAWHHELGVAQPLRRDFELSASLGRFSSDAVPGGAYTYWDAGVSKVMRRVGLDLRYHTATLDQPSVAGDPGGERWVLSVSLGLVRR